VLLVGALALGFLAGRWDRVARLGDKHAEAEVMSRRPFQCNSGLEIRKSIHERLSWLAMRRRDERCEPLDPKDRAADRYCFSSPGEVVESLALPPGEKRRILLQWLEDEKALFVADEEGMQGDRPSQIDQVHRALRALKE
jgi:hypothetical protein